MIVFYYPFQMISEGSIKRSSGKRSSLQLVRALREAVFDDQHQGRATEWFSCTASRQQIAL